MADEEVPTDSGYQVTYLDEEEQATPYNWLKRAGPVRIVYPNGDSFEGVVDENKVKQGFGTYIWKGIPSNAEASGEDSGDGDGGPVEISRFEGNFQDGRKHGQGKMTFPNGDVYQGQWANDLMEGTGSYKYSKSKDIYSGGWVGGKKSGNGIYEIFSDKSVFDGEWVNNTIATGRWITKQGVYHGQFKGGKPIGAGKFVLANGITQQGEYIEEVLPTAPSETATENKEGEEGEEPAKEQQAEDDGNGEATTTAAETANPTETILTKRFWKGVPIVSM